MPVNGDPWSGRQDQWFWCKKASTRHTHTHIHILWKPFISHPSGLRSALFTPFIERFAYVLHDVWHEQKQRHEERKKNGRRVVACMHRQPLFSYPDINAGNEWQRNCLLWLLFSASSYSWCLQRHSLQRRRKRMKQKKRCEWVYGKRRMGEVNVPNIRVVRHCITRGSEWWCEQIEKKVSSVIRVC